MTETTDREQRQAHDHDPRLAFTGASIDAGCKQAIEELYAFLDGHLTEEKRHTIQQHLDDCSPCLEAFEFETELRFVVAHRCKEEVPESLRLKVAKLLAHPHTADLDGAEP